MSRFAPDFRFCLLASAALHAGFFLFSFARLPSFAPAGSVEIDLTSPFLGSGPARRAAPKRLIPEAKRPPAPVEQPLPPQVETPREVPKQWTLPGPETKTILPPKAEEPPLTQGGAVDGTGTSHLPGGSGGGDPFGAINGRGDGGSPAGVIRPRLLNLDEVLANLRKYYPERERIANHEGTVVVDIHIGVDGSIAGVDVLQSAGRLFDAAAVKVARLMRFEPARTAAGPVAAKVRKTMQFKLED